MVQQGRKRLSLKEKLEIIEYKKQFPLTKNTRIADIFSERFQLKIHARSIKNFLVSEDTIRNAYLLNENLLSVPRSIKQKEVEKQLKEWIDMVEGRGGYISEAILKSKALKIYNSLNLQDASNLNEDVFTASNGWIHRFKKR
ncbi:Major centromere autoantigen B [Dictyocoela muelleri]|nr:Major centromere autoantigen B [Dictyocoela muelleri]